VRLEHGGTKASKAERCRLLGGEWRCQFIGLCNSAAIILMKGKVLGATPDPVPLRPPQTLRSVPDLSVKRTLTDALRHSLPVLQSFFVCPISANGPFYNFCPTGNDALSISKQFLTFRKIVYPSFSGSRGVLPRLKMLFRNVDTA